MTTTAAAATTSSPMVLSLLLFASLTALLVLAPRVHPPLARGNKAVVLGAEEAPPAAAGSYADLDTGAVGAEEEGADDLALFRRVTLDDSGEGALAVARSPPKVAFLFLTNSDLTFAPLWERFFSGHGSLLNVYVHADPSQTTRPKLTDIDLYMFLYTFTSVNSGRSSKDMFILLKPLSDFSLFRWLAMHAFLPGPCMHFQLGIGIGVGVGLLAAGAALARAPETPVRIIF